jgi:hypothetical protein
MYRPTITGAAVPTTTSEVSAVTGRVLREYPQ